MSDLILSASGVRKRFDGRDILKGVSLSLQKGDVVAIIGRSGSGKSTFLRCLAELERIDAGRIEIGGEAMVDTEKKGYEPESRLRVIRRRMGYVFQDFNLFPHFTVLRNITDVIVVQADGTQTALGLGGYLDIGLLDTMEDLFVNFIGALTFSIIGYFYVRSRGQGKFAKRFIPVANNSTMSDGSQETELTEQDNPTE